MIDRRKLVTSLAAMGVSPLLSTASSANPWLARAIWRLLVGSGRRQAVKGARRSVVSKAATQRATAGTARQIAAKKSGMRFIDKALIATDAVMIAALIPSFAHAIQTHNEKHPDLPKPRIWLKDGYNPFSLEGKNIEETDIEDVLDLYCLDFETQEPLAVLPSLEIKVLASSDFSVGLYQNELPNSLPLGRFITLAGVSQRHESLFVADSEPIFVADTNSVAFVGS